MTNGKPPDIIILPARNMPSCAIIHNSPAGKAWLQATLETGAGPVPRIGSEDMAEVEKMMEQAGLKVERR